MNKLLKLTALSVSAASIANAASMAFKGDLQVYNLSVSNPIQVNPESKENSTVSFTIIDEDYPELKPVNCDIGWLPGTNPPEKAQHSCDNDTLHVWFPTGTFKGVEDFRLDFSHAVIDEGIGKCPQYCHLTKFATLNLTYPATQNYECDMDKASCQSTTDTRLRAVVTSAVG